MTEKSEVRALEIDFSLGDLFDKSTIYTAFMSARACVNLVQKAGYRGIEWMPFRSVAGMQMKMGAVNQATKDAIVSLHQSYRSETSLGHAWHHPNKMLALISYAVLPERVASLKILERLQKVIGRDMPVVLYPEKIGEESGTNKNFREKMFQPTPGVMEEWGVKTVDELIIEAKKRGYTGFCIDLAHMRGAAKGAFTLHPWQETLPKLLPFAQEIHISAGRVDMPYKDTYAELQDLVHGTKQTELPQMLAVIKQSGYSGRVVTEIPAAALHAMHGKGKFLSIKTLIEDHTAIVGNIKTWLS